MFRTLMIGAVSAAALTLSAAAFAQQGGTALEARAMLDKAGDHKLVLDRIKRPLAARAQQGGR
jgi:hypothetical protein